MKTFLLTDKNQKATKNHRVAAGLLFMLLVISTTLFAQPRADTPPAEFIAASDQPYMNAVWSPDGQSVAFTSHNYNGIWISDANGKEIRLLTADQGAGFGFAWSPDGNYILARTAITENRRRYHQVKLFDVSNKSYEIVVEKTRNLHGLPSWSSDGDGVVFVLDGKAQMTTLPGKRQSRKQQQEAIIYNIHNKLFTFNPATRLSSEIANFEGRQIFNITKSGNGEKVVFQVQGLGLHVINADGSGLRNLGQAERATWMPDGKYVIATMVEDDGHYITGGELYAIDVNTAEQFHLTAHTGITALKPNVSPDGKWVLFDNPEDGNIYIMELK